LEFVLIAAATWMQPNKLLKKNEYSLKFQCVEEYKTVLKLHKNVILGFVADIVVNDSVFRQ
jgi:hypothetical protein